MSPINCDVLFIDSLNKLIDSAQTIPKPTHPHNKGDKYMKFVKTFPLNLADLGATNSQINLNITRDCGEWRVDAIKQTYKERNHSSTK